jgi:hypothetical protein
MTRITITKQKLDKVKMQVMGKLMFACFLMKMRNSHLAKKRTSKPDCHLKEVEAEVNKATKVFRVQRHSIPRKGR